jgi:hypothetical protein
MQDIVSMVLTYIILNGQTKTCTGMKSNQGKCSIEVQSTQGMENFMQARKGNLVLVLELL